MKKSIMLWVTAVLLGFAVLATPKTVASTMIFGNPSRPNNGVSYNPSTGYILIPFEVTNNDSGTEYSGAVVNSPVGSPTDILSGFQGLYNFGNNSSTYSSISDMLGSMTNIKVNADITLDSNQGYVNNGWITGFNADGGIRIEPAFPGYNIEEHWVDDSYIVNNTAKGTLQIGCWLYDGDGDPGNFTLDRNLVAPGDAIPIIDPTAFIPDAAVGRTTTEFDSPTSGNYLSMEVFPAPIPLALAGGVLSFDSQSNTTYRIESTCELGTNMVWITCTNLLAAGTNTTYQLPLTNNLIFFRGFKE